MTADTVSPPVISFKECRDEEIAGFFANEGNKFHPVLPYCKEAAKSRVVGSPHFLLKGKKGERKATARFVSAGAAPSIQLCRSTLDGGISEESRHSPLSKPVLAPGTLSTSGNSAQLRNRAAKIVCDPLEGKPLMRSLQAQKAISVLTGSNVNEVSLMLHKPEKKTPQPHTVVLPATAEKSDNGVQESLLERLEIVDEQLQMLVNSWPKIPDRFKETIRALVEASSNEIFSKEPGASTPAE